MALSAAWRSAPGDTRVSGERLARRHAFAAVRRHSRRVAAMRVLLPIAGVLAVAGFVVKSRLALPDDIDVSAASFSVTRNSIIMDRPHLTGFGDDRRGYSLSADRAIQPLGSPGEVRLEEIAAKVDVPNQGETVITAEAGDYDHEKSTLDLLGAIAVSSADGYRLRMHDASVDFGAGTLVSDKPVSIGYADSEITGERMAVSDGGKVIVIEGRVRTVLMPPKREPSASAPAGPMAR